MEKNSMTFGSFFDEMISIHGAAPKTREPEEELNNTEGMTFGRVLAEAISNVPQDYNSFVEELFVHRGYNVTPESEMVLSETG